jgi:hypothetical protein
MHQCRLENKSDFYNTLCMWWDEWNFPHVSYTSLPERMFVVSKNGIDLYAIPVYVGDSDICMMGFVTGNKKSTKELRSGALNILNKYIEEVMKRDGYRIIMTVTGTPVLKKMFSDEDYIISGKDYNEYIKIL